MAEEKGAKKEEKALKTVVVKELPTQAMNQVMDEKGNEFALLTTEEALTEILEIARALKKGLL